MGKMIDAQSIVVAAAATGEGGKEGSLLRAVFGHSLALALLVAAIVWVYAHVLPGVVVGIHGSSIGCAFPRGPDPSPVSPHGEGHRTSGCGRGMWIRGEVRARPAPRPPL